MTMSRTIVGAVIALALIGCDGAAPTEQPAASPADAYEALIAWAESTPMTCAQWNDLQESQALAEATTMLQIVAQGLERATETSPEFVAAFSATITEICAGGSDCTNPDLFCDTDRVGLAAVAAYVETAQ